MNALNYSLKLETLFRSMCPGIGVSRDGFSCQPKETLQTGLKHLCAEGLLTKDDVAFYMATYDFGEGSLADYLSVPENEEWIQELIRQLEALKEQNVITNKNKSEGG